MDPGVVNRLRELPTGHLEKRLAEGLPALYNDFSEGGLVVAHLCDVYLDRTGNLLGWVRAAARELRAAKAAAKATP
jgi:hypothetical protein